MGKRKSTILKPSLWNVSVLCASIRMTMTVVGNSADNFPQKIKHIVALYTMFSAAKTNDWIVDRNMISEI